MPKCRNIAPVIVPMKRKTRIRIHREGHKILLVTCAVLIALNLFTTLYLKNPALNAVTVTMSVLLVGCFAYFFRLPHREFVTGNCQVIAPADGRIVVIEETYEQEYFKDKRIQVSIFMSPTNVHVNRSPISGVVTYQKYHPGKYLVAWHPKSSEKNERNTIVLEHEESDTEILIRQIAGKLARKIRWYFNEGDTVMQNAELGFIKFGSRVDMFLPLGTKIDVSLRQKVKGGVTVIGTLPENN